MTLAKHPLAILIIGLLLGGGLGCVPEAAGTTEPSPTPSAGPGPQVGPGPGATAPDLCAYAAAGDGPYCARSLLMGSADNLLYVCARGATVSQTPCPGRCSQGPDGMPGADDACEGGAPPAAPQPTPTPPAVDPRPADGDPCAAANLGDGPYCARALDPTAAGGELYHCVAGQATSIIHCPAGCQINPPGVEDVCVGAKTTPAPAPAPTPTSSDPCRNATLGNGGYCARSLDPTSTSSKLYQCVGQKTASVTACPNGCQQMPPGVNDVCAGATSPPIVPTDGTAPSCSAAQAGACGGDGKYCTSQGQCQSCAAGMFNCNGSYGCECKYGCYNGGCLQCSASVAFACGSNTGDWCYEGQCRQCSAGYFNCDGKAGCECTKGCNGTKCK